MFMIIFTDKIFRRFIMDNIKKVLDVLGSVDDF